jgi:hypothetical protein
MTWILNLPFPILWIAALLPIALLLHLCHAKEEGPVRKVVLAIWGFGLGCWFLRLLVSEFIHGSNQP